MKITLLLSLNIGVNKQKSTKFNIKKIAVQRKHCLCTQSYVTKVR